MKNIVIYWSGTGNTTVMAQEIAEGMGAELYTVSDFNGNLADYDKIAFGCSAMGDEVLEEAEFEPFYTAMEPELRGKKVALFGSYGWGDGQWMREWYDRASKAGLNVFDEGLMVCGFPDPDAKANCKKYGEAFANY